MTDFATVVITGANGVGFDWALDGPALATDDGLRTAVILSLFTDAEAAPDDILPDGSGDRRGTWMDQPVDGGPKDLMGSKLWLLARAKATTETAARAQRYANDSLQWLLADGVADQVQVTASWLNGEDLALAVAITRQVNGQPVNHRYDFVWNTAQAAPSSFT